MSANKKILIVEDNQIQRSLLAKLLEREGYDVKSAENGLEGLNYAREFNPDFVLLDYKMPVMNGLQMATHLKKEGFTAFIIFLTSQSEITGTFHLNKPIDFVSLKNLISNLSS